MVVLDVGVVRIFSDNFIFTSVGSTRGQGIVNVVVIAMLVDIVVATFSDILIKATGMCKVW